MMNKKFLTLTIALIILFFVTACDVFETDAIGDFFDNINIISDLGDTISNFFDSIVDSIDIRIPKITIF